MSKIWSRICYEQGNVKTGKKLYELHKDCDCEMCRRRVEIYHYPANAVTATTSDKSKIDKVMDILRKWSCNDKSNIEDIFRTNGYGLNGSNITYLSF